MFYTLGQRQGLGIGGVKDAPDEPWYVVKKDVSSNTLFVAQGNNHEALFSTGMLCKSIAWVDGLGPDLPMKLMVKTRYRQDDQACHIEKEADKNKGGYRITFETAQRAVTPGQWACFYSGDTCLGGGIIESTELVCP